MTTISRAIQALRRLAILAIAVVAALHAGPASAESAAAPPRSAALLEQLVAPIALYPDSLLSQVLMASTYPLEVVEAARWSRENSGVTGQALEDAVQKQTWDPSVKALTFIPQTLQMMNDKLDWTQQLGDAFLAQQGDVLDAVQRLRARADAAGHLQTTQEQKVTRTPASPRPAPTGQAAAPALVYTIEPANPEIYYVPIYDPAVVYGAWPYAEYAPFYWYPPGYVASNVFSFAAGVVVGAAVWSHVDWRRNRIDIDVNRFNRFNRTNITDNTWAHNPAHRKGVPYRDSNVAQRFTDQGKAAAREAFRGKAEAGQRDLAKQGAAGKRDLAKQGATGKGDVGKQGGERDAKGKTAAKSKTAAGSKATAQTKQAAKSKQVAKSKETTKTRQAAKPKHAGSSQAARQRATQPTARRDVGMRSQAQHNVRASGGAGGHRGGGGRGGGRRR
jgi:hypothetical protein